MSSAEVPRRVYVTDCEGPLSRNDNAQELAAHFIPQGADFFARLSRYDDFLADVERRPGYNAGDTLRLLAPFLLAFGAGDAAVVRFSADNVLLVPRAQQLLHTLPRLLPTFIISTSYTPYVRALCEVTGFDPAHCRCTELALDEWTLDAGEAAWLRERAAWLAARPLIDIPTSAASRSDLSAKDRETIAELDRLFWEEMDGLTCGRLLAAVRPVGGAAKLEALESIVAEVGCHGHDVMYVGDSITDALALEAVRRWGGMAVSFNGNTYALEAAEVAVAAADVSPMYALARAFAQGGAIGVRAQARNWPAKAGGLVGLLNEKQEVLAAASQAARVSVRGERIAALG